MIRPWPVLFVSHGAPSLALEENPARDFLAQLGRDLGRPSSILAVSAHWASPEPRLSAAPWPETWHDFYGFPPELYRLTYPAPGAPQLANRAASLLRAAGFPAQEDSERGLDHGAWVPLSLMYPQADIPVAQLSLQPALGPHHHFRLGTALRPLRDEGVLILASGGATHNLSKFGKQGLKAPVPEWVTQFSDWLAAALGEGRFADLLDYRAKAPHAARNHPTEEHLLPLLLACGAAAPDSRGSRLHHSYAYGALAMDAYLFE